MKQVHLVCNAHLDPVWQWEWDEGFAETLSTFRIAADFCEEYDGFVFNHNEALLYEWVEKADPELFERIQNLVKQKKWHIIGGWYLQPDCNMPSGESIIRQIVVGRTYFKEKFGARPTTAVNFDSFGHNRGLVQILEKCGYDSYLFTRPLMDVCGIPSVDFIWEGYNNSKIVAHVANEGYNSKMGKAVQKITGYVQKFGDQDRLLLLWGIGNHGGGPSRIDLTDIASLKGEMEKNGTILIHSTPEAYFSGLDTENLPSFAESLNPSMVGCYTSQARIKQKHRQLENLLLSAEKTASVAELKAGHRADWDKILEAEKILLFNEFHDILPGTTVKRAEEASLRSLDRGLDILTHERTMAFMAMALHQEKVSDGDIAVYVFNPHPFAVKRIVECEFQLQDQNWEETYTVFDAFQDGKAIPCQMEKEDSSIPLDWRKRIAFEAELAPFAITAVTCRPRRIPAKPVIKWEDTRYITISNDKATLVIDTKTGWIDRYAVNGVDLLSNSSGKLLIIQDDEDPWGMRVTSFPDVCGEFTLAGAETAGIVSGLKHPLPPVHVIEQGDVRTVVEAIFQYERSTAVVHYIFNHNSSAFNINVRLLWMEPEKMIKMSLPFALKDVVCYGQAMFGREEIKTNGKEAVFQKWVAVSDNTHALTVINKGIYAGSFNSDEIRLTLLRSPAYCAHPLGDRKILPDDRFLPRIDMGEHYFEFVVEGGEHNSLLQEIDKKAQIENEPPYALSLFPDGKGSKDKGFIQWSNENVLLSSFRKKGTGYVMRVFNPDDKPQNLSVAIPDLQIDTTLSLGSFEIKAFYLSKGRIDEISLDEADIECCSF